MGSKSPVGRGDTCRSVRGLVFQALESSKHKEQVVNIPGQCESLEQVRANIDRIDRQLVTLLAKRGGYVAQAARFKKNDAQVRAPQRVEQVIAKVTALAGELGADAVVTERVYRAMIAAFIEAELAEHRALNP